LAVVLVLEHKTQVRMRLVAVVAVVVGFGVQKMERLELQDKVLLAALQVPRLMEAQAAVVLVLLESTRGLVLVLVALVVQVQSRQ
jgi:hypothetical protein